MMQTKTTRLKCLEVCLKKVREKVGKKLDYRKQARVHAEEDPCERFEF
jgi:hypothetical protein